MNIAEITAVYIAEKRRVRRESTVEGYESALRLHVLPRWGACGIDEIDPDDLQAWVLGFDQPVHRLGINRLRIRRLVDRRCKGRWNRAVHHGMQRHRAGGGFVRSRVSDGQLATG